MSKPKWYNWTNDSDWDEYCLFTSIVLIWPLIGLMGAILIAAIIMTVQG